MPSIVQGAAGNMSHSTTAVKRKRKSLFGKKQATQQVLTSLQNSTELASQNSTSTHNVPRIKALNQRSKAALNKPAVMLSSHNQYGQVDPGPFYNT